MSFLSALSLRLESEIDLAAVEQLGEAELAEVVLGAAEGVKEALAEIRARLQREPERCEPYTSLRDRRPGGGPRAGGGRPR